MSNVLITLGKAHVKIDHLQKINLQTSAHDKWYGLKQY